VGELLLPRLEIDLRFAREVVVLALGECQALEEDGLYRPRTRSIAEAYGVA
jgi:hypothetical protein